MRKHAIKNTVLLLALALTVLFGSAKTTLCQQTANSTQTEEQKRIALVSALERAQSEVRAGRKYIDGLKDQVKSKEAQIDGLNSRDVQRVKIQNSLEAEITNLRAAIDEQKRALKIKEDETDYLKSELKKVQKKLKSSHTREKVLAASTGILFLLLLLK